MSKKPEHKCVSDFNESNTYIIACQLCDWTTTATDAKFIKDIVDNHNVLNGYWPFREHEPMGWEG